MDCICRLKKLIMISTRDKHEELKLRAQNEVKAHSIERRKRRLQVLDLIVSRACHFGSQTGEVDIGKDQDTLGDDGLNLLVKYFPDASGLTSLSIVSHDISEVGAKTLASLISSCINLQCLILSGNRYRNEGAESICAALTTLSRLQRLDLAENEIDIFPAKLVRCTSLIELFIQHNMITTLPLDIGLHPQLTMLHVLHNPITNVRPESTSSTQKLLEALLEAKVSEACSKAAANSEQQPAILSKHITYPLEEVDVSIPPRWASAPSHIAGILEKYPTLRSLNQLHEWPSPPLAPSTAWDLAGRLTTPLYEAVFVANRLNAAQHLTRLDISRNDLRGPAAQKLARAIAGHSCLAELDAVGCVWDDAGQRSFADGSAAAAALCRVNEARAIGTEPRWDLRGAISSIVEMEFVAARMRRCNTDLVALDLRRNDLPSTTFAAIAGALPSCAALTRLDGISAAVDERSWSLRKRLLFDGGKAAAGDGGAASRRRAASPPRSSPNLAAELCFISAAAERCGELAELDLSSNCLGDAGIALVAQLIIPFSRRVAALHLHQNGITAAGATTLGEALAGGNHGVETLRLSENPVGSAGLAAIAAGFALRRQRRPRGFPGPRGRVVQLHFDSTGVGPTLPDALFALDTLEVLSIRDNSVAALDTGLCRLTCLRALVLDGNPLVFPPPAVAAHGTAAVLACLAEAEALGRARSRHLRAIRCEWGGLPDGPEPHDARAVEAAARRTVAALSRGDSRPELEPSATESESPPAASPAVAALSTLRSDETQRAMSAGHVLQRHGREVLSVCFGGGLLATCGADRTVKLWARQPASDGARRGPWTCCDTLRGHSDSVNAIALHEDSLAGGSSGGLLLASGSADGTVRLWTLGDCVAAPMTEQSAAMGGIGSVSTSAAGTAGDLLCDWECIQVLRRVEAPDAALRGSSVTAVAFSDTNATPRLASGAADGCILIWGPANRPSQTGASVTASAAVLAAAEEPTYEEAQLLAAHAVLRRLFDEHGHGGVRPAAAAAVPSRRRRPAPDGMSYPQLVGLCEKIGLLEGISRARLFALYRQVRSASRHRSGDLDFPAFGLLLWRVCMAARRAGPPQLPAGPPHSPAADSDVTAVDPPCGEVVGEGWRCEWTPFGTVREVVAGASVTAVETLFSPYAGRRRLLGPAAATAASAAAGPPPPPPPWTRLFVLDGHEGAVLGLVWLPAACACLATAGADSSVRLWQYSEKRAGRGSWAPVFKGFGHEGPVLSLTCGPPSPTPVLSPRQANIGLGSTFSVSWNGGSVPGKMEGNLVEAGPAVVVSASADGTALVWEVVERRFELVGRAHIGYTLRKGRRMHPPHPSHSVSSAAHATGAATTSVSSIAAVSACSLRRDGQLLATADVVGVVALWVPSAGGGWRCEEREKQHGGRVAACSFGEGEHAGLLATCGDDFAVCVRDTTTAWPLAAASGATPEIAHAVRAPSRECQPFQLRRPPADFVLIDLPAVMHALSKLATAATAPSAATILVGPEHSERLRLGCQLGDASQRAVEVHIAAGAVWSSTRFATACWNADTTAAAAAAVSGFQFVGPLVRLWPEEALFRVPVSIRIPHHASPKYSAHSSSNGHDPNRDDSLKHVLLVRFAGDSVGGRARLEVVPGSVVLKGHAKAVLSVFSGFLAVVRRLTPPLQPAVVPPVAQPIPQLENISARLSSGSTLNKVNSPPSLARLQEGTADSAQDHLGEVDDAYCLILQPGGVPLVRTFLGLGKWFHCLAEIIPAAHFAPALTLAPPFWSALASSQVIHIRRGAALSNLDPVLLAPFASDSFAIEVLSMSQQRWEGEYALVEFRIRVKDKGGFTVSPSKQHASVIRRQIGSSGMGNTASVFPLAGKSISPTPSSSSILRKAVIHNTGHAGLNIHEANHSNDRKSQESIPHTMSLNDSNILRGSGGHSSGQQSSSAQVGRSSPSFSMKNMRRLISSSGPQNNSATAQGNAQILRFSLELGFATDGDNQRDSKDSGLAARLGPFEVQIQPI